MNEFNMTVSAAAFRLQVRYNLARDLMLRGVIDGRHDGTRWMISEESVERYRRERESQRGAGAGHPAQPKAAAV